jgi:hypothetical protein
LQLLAVRNGDLLALALLVRFAAPDDDGQPVSSWDEVFGLECDQLRTESSGKPQQQQRAIAQTAQTAQG